MKTLEYTHRNLRLQDIRYRGSNEKGYYMLAFEAIPPVNIDKSIFENVLFKIYGPLFIKDLTLTTLLATSWNVVISDGYFMQWSHDQYVRVDGVANRHYISRIDKAGVLSELTYA